jgi:hypothetical protein
MNTSGSERSENDSPSAGDDFMDFVAALVRTRHPITRATDEWNGRRESDRKSPKAAARHDSKDSDPSASVGRSQ